MGDASLSVEFKVLGPLEVVCNGRVVPLGGARQRLVLAALVASANAVVSADRLIDIVWGDEPPDSALSTLQKYVYRLRGAIDPGTGAAGSGGRLLTRAPGYLLRIDANESDAARFEQLLGGAQRRAAAGDFIGATVVFEEALGLWRGPAFAEFADLDFIRGEVARLDGLRAVAVEDRVEVGLAAGRHAELVGELEATVAAYPLRERPRAQLMLALYRCGRQAEALRAYEAFRRYLGEEVGLEPSEALVRLADAIVLQKPELDRAWPPAPSAVGREIEPSVAFSGGRTPVMVAGVEHAPGLFPGELAVDTGPIVGRERELEWLEVLWRRAAAGERVAAVVHGPAGIGKSRLVGEFARRVNAQGAAVVYSHGAPRSDSEQAVSDFPVLAVVEDLDAGRVGAADLLSGSPPADTGILVVATSRSAHDWDGPVKVRELAGLSVADVGVLLSSVFGAGGPVPATLAEAVHRETDGNPALVSEVARTLRDRDVADRLERALERVGAATREARSLRDQIANGVLRRGPPPVAVAKVARSERAVCPYKGLARFEAADAPFFFGRERLVGALVSRLAVDRFVGVVGASGSGKSSLVRAGLLPALATGALPGSEAWPVCVCTPGGRPFVQLAERLGPLAGVPASELGARLERQPEELDAVLRAALRGRGDARVLLVVDQFEEIITVCHDARAREAFVAALVDAASDDGPAVVVVVVRADYYGDLLVHPDLIRLFEQSQVLVGAMTDAELRRAVVEPARRAGLTVEDGLADVVCGDTAGEPGALPLVSTALFETWVRRDGDILTLAGYRQAGGVNGALARLGEDVYASFDAAEQAATRKLFLCLAEPGAGLDDVRRRIPRDELPDDAGYVLDALVQRRLLVADAGSVEVAHEALLREWPRLRVWLEQDREGRRMHHQLSEAATAWEAEHRDRAGLYRGTRLAAAQEWVSVHPEDANGRELEFINASLAEQDAELRSARRTARRLRRLTVGVALVAVVALLAGGVALVQRAHADQKAAAARRAATAADAGRLAARAQSLPINQLDLAMLLAVQGRDLQQSATTDGALEAVLVHTPPGLDRTVELGAPAVCGQLSPDGRLVASGTVEGYTHLIDVASGRTLHTFPNIVDSKRCPSLAFSSDGSRLVASGTTGNVVVWDTATGRQILTIRLPAASVRYAMVAGEPRPGRLVTSTGDGTVILWDTTDVARPTRAATFYVPATNGIFAAVALADAAAPNRIAISNFDHTYVWNIATHTLAYPALPGRTGPESPDGSTLVTQTATQFLIWDVATGKPRRTTLAGVVPDPSWPGIFSPDGTRLAVLDRISGSVVIVDLPTRRRLASIPMAGFGGPGPFLKDGRLSVFTGQTMTLWRIGVNSPAPFAAPIGPAGSPAYAYFTPDGSKVLTLGPNGLHTWDPTTGAPLRPLLGGRFDAPTQISNPVWPSFSPDGALIAWGARNGKVTLWDATSGRRLGALASGTANFDVAWAPRGRVLAVGGPGGAMTLWSLTDPVHPVRLGNMTAPDFPPDMTPRPLFSPNGRFLAAVRISSVALSDQLSLFDVSTGRLVRTIQTTAGFMDTADFSPDSRTLATDILDLGSGTSRIILWDLATGRARTTRFVPYLTGGVAFVAGGRWLATPELDTGASVGAEAAGSARVDLWDATTLLPIGEPLRVPGDAALLLETGLAPYRLALGTTSSNGTPMILDLDPAHWQTMACHLAGRNLTRAEWNEYLPGRSYQTTCPQWPAGT
jgi:DNA-binding SARP family transcriptional activator/WD40 repeat protein